jgi:type IV secretion system protein VirD4
MADVTDNGFIPGLYWDPDRDRTEEYVVIEDFTTILINGPPRVGKTNLVIENACRWKRAVIGDDMKGEPTAILGPLMQRKRYGGLRVINPENLHVATHPHMADSGWNTLADLDPDDDDYPDDCRNIVITLNDRHGNTEGNGAFFDGNATEFGTVLLHNLRAENPNATLPDWRMLSASGYGIDHRGDPLELLDLMERLSKSPDPALAAKAKPFARATKANQDVASTLTQTNAWLDSRAIRRSMQGPGIDWAGLKNSTRMLSFVVPPERAIAFKPYRRLFWRTALRELVRAPSTGQFPPAILFIDEFPQLGRVDELLSAVAYAPGYHLRPVLITQDFTQLAARSAYGDDWETFVTAASVICSFRPSSLFTAKYLSDMCGNKIVMQHTANVKGQGGTISPQERRLFEPQQLMQMPPGRMLVLVQGMRPFFVQVENYWEGRFARQLAPNPYRPTKGRRQ